MILNIICICIYIYICKVTNLYGVINKLFPNREQPKGYRQWGIANRQYLYIYIYTYYYLLLYTYIYVYIAIYYYLLLFCSVLFCSLRLDVYGIVGKALRAYASHTGQRGPTKERKATLNMAAAYPHLSAARFAGEGPPSRLWHTLERSTGYSSSNSTGPP